MQHHHHWIAFLIFFFLQFFMLFWVSEFNEIFSASLSKFVVKTHNHHHHIPNKRRDEETVPKVTSRDRNWEISTYTIPVEEEHNSRFCMNCNLLLRFCDFCDFFFVCIRKTLREKGDSEERREEESFVVLWWVSQAAINGKLYAIINFDD